MSLLGDDIADIAPHDVALAMGWLGPWKCTPAHLPAQMLTIEVGLLLVMRGSTDDADNHDVITSRPIPLHHPF